MSLELDDGFTYELNVPEPKNIDECLFGIELVFAMIKILKQSSKKWKSLKEAKLSADLFLWAVEKPLDDARDMFKKAIRGELNEEKLKEILGFEEQRKG